MNELLTCTGLIKQYGSKTALDNLNLTLPRGRIIGLLGPNGSGKTTLIKLINGVEPSPETKKVVSYLPERTYFNSWMKVRDILDLLCAFYTDFRRNRAEDMLQRLDIDPTARLSTMSKGTKEKVQLIMVMSRDADLYCLDEPIGGVDPAARDYILQTIISNYSENASVLISTHLISDIENVLDDVIFIQNGHIRLHTSVDAIREQEGKSVDALFREVFRC